MIEAKRAGLLPEKKRQPADVFVSLAAKSMEEQERRRQAWTALQESFRETAVGMMENIQEAGETAGSLRHKVAEQLRQEIEQLRKR